MSGPIDGQRRRSIYLASRRSFPSTFLDVFDKPPPLSTFGRRDITNVPTQALTLLNDPFVSEQAKAWSQRIAKQSTTTDSKIEQMFLEAFSRKPNEFEQKWAHKLIGHENLNWHDLAMALFNAKEFIYVP